MEEVVRWYGGTKFQHVQSWCKDPQSGWQLTLYVALNLPALHARSQGEPPEAYRRTTVPPYQPLSQRCPQPAAHQRCTDARRPTRFMHSCSQPPAPPCQQTCLRARLSVQCAAAVGRACTCTSAAGLTPPPRAVEPRPTSASRPRVGSTAGLWITAQLLLSSGIIIGPR